MKNQPHGGHGGFDSRNPERGIIRNMKKNKGLEVPILWFLALHLSLIVNSIQGVFSKLAGREKTLSPMWILFFGLMFVALFTFAVAWQQVLKHMSLTFAFTNKPITIIWGLVWGVLIFQEKVTWNMVLGSVIILVGIMVGVSGGQPQQKTGSFVAGGEAGKEEQH